MISKIEVFNILFISYFVINILKITYGVVRVS